MGVIVCVSMKWKQIPGWEHYRVNDKGNVQSGVCSFNIDGLHSIVWKDIKASVKPNGYYKVSFYRPGLNRTFHVHRLVAEAFVDGRTREKKYVCHNDNDPSNNRAENLRWDTQKGNIAHKYKFGTENIGERNPGARLTKEQVIEIRDLYSNGYTKTQLLIKFGVSFTCISDIVNLRSWKDVN